MIIKYYYFLSWLLSTINVMFYFVSFLAAAQNNLPSEINLVFILSFLNDFH